MDERNVRPSVESAAPSGSDVSPGTSLSGTSVDDEAFSAFYRKFVPRLVGFLVWQGARLPDATEITQDTMAMLYRRWSGIDHPETWARRVASRMLASRISVEHDLVEEVPERNVLLPPSIDVETWEQRHDILRLLGHLPPRQRQVMAWALDGYTPSEIANELSITAEAVRANLVKARRALIAYAHADNDER